MEPKVNIRYRVDDAGFVRAAEPPKSLPQIAKEFTTAAALVLLAALLMAIL